MQATETQIGTTLWQVYPANELAIGIEDMNAV